MKINAEHFPFAVYGSLLAFIKEQNKNELRIHDALRPIGDADKISHEEAVILNEADW